MDPLTTLALLLVLAAVAVWWWRRRRPASPAEDEWTPPAQDTGGRPAPAGPALLNRDMVLKRDRVLDPTKWDNTPDREDRGAAEDPTGEGQTADTAEPPRFIDRDYLQRRDRAEGPGAGPDPS